MIQTKQNNKFPLKVLVAEDDFPSRIFITSIVKNLFDDVVAAENGQEGLALYESERPDFIVTDIGMPFMNGLEMSRQIRKMNANIPIILTTAFDNKSVLLDAIEIGVNHYIIKPIIKEQIIDAISKVAYSIMLELEVKKNQENIRTLHSAIEHSSGIVVIFDLDGTITYVNPKFVHLTGLLREDVYGQVFRVFYTNDIEQYAEFEEAIQEKAEWHGEFSIVNKSEKEIFVHASLSPILLLKGDVKSFVLVADDITEKKIVEKRMLQYNESLEEMVRERTSELNSTNRLLLDEIETRKLTEIQLITARDEAEAANKAKGLFLAKVSHELRTPMNGILGMTSILLDTNIDEKQRRSLNIVKHSGESLLSIINDILDWSKIETGKFSLDKYPFKLREVLNYTHDLLYPISAGKGIDFIVHTNKDVQDEIIGDPNRLHQVLVNLIGNAIKFTEEGLIELVVSNAVKRDNHIELEFSIRDTGIGIADDKLHRLFKSFSQIDNNLTRKYGGTGLGLAISKEIVEMMGGTIYCESTEGVGSVFHFTAKFDIPENESASKESVENEFGLYSEIYPDFNLNILIAEDSAINQEVIQESIIKKNCTFSTAGNGLEAVELYKNEKFDIIFMDLQMPVCDGFKATELILNYEKEQNLDHIPIVALTAHDDSDSKEACRNAGMDEFITKPFKWNEMYRILSKYKKNINLDNVEANKPADIDSLMISINNNTILLTKLLNYFIANVPNELEKLKSEIDAENHDKVRHITHKLKSEIGNFKAVEAVELLARMEQKGKTKNLENILSDYASLEVLIDKVITHFKSYLEK